LQQVALSAVHANAVIGLKVPAAGALFASNGAAEESEGQDESEGFHCVWESQRFWVKTEELNNEDLGLSQ
jgi:hypothetical protein